MQVFETFCSGNKLSRIKKIMDLRDAIQQLLKYSEFLLENIDKICTMNLIWLTPALVSLGLLLLFSVASDFLSFPREQLIHPPNA